MKILLPTTDELKRRLDDEDDAVETSTVNASRKINPILSVHVVNSDTESTVSNIDFDWTVTDITDKALQFKLDFLEPILVSNSQDSMHRVEVEVLDDRAFHG